MKSLFTIGVYGTSEEAFFACLQSARVDTFCDIRWRRGVRRSEYAFANSYRLQERLAELSIRYVYLRELAPTPELRARQYKADKETHTAKRQRTVLADAFAEGYKHEILDKFDASAFADKLGPDAQNVVLFCVEREPGACHRSILAHKLQQEVGTPVTHLIANEGPRRGAGACV